MTNDYVRPYVLWEVTRILLEADEPTLAIHAGSVALDGRAIVIAGVSHAGKSTLSGWLVAHGWGFLTDEVSRLEQSGEGWRVHPFPRPIGVRRPTPLEPFVQPEFGEATEILVPASTLGTLSGVADLTAIVLPERRPGASSTPTPAHPATAVRLLAEHLPKRASDGRAGFRTLVDLMQSVPVYSLHVDNLGAAERALRELVAGDVS
ncbi:hypothetical protein GA707_14715 [Nostocoides sp. F2B08]|uniref:hypothetical protein n=1 Tax=Nostocoides sp. F2B08 TaxID=2653936 RepID=UPI001263C5F4|nr:hypothetical protein [Tetrasphaera sp. F2B08]KAB7743347.1 hypothetical protein GA707_14715 [Tetrasphaera sp. F2B08]